MAAQLQQVGTTFTEPQTQPQDKVDLNAAPVSQLQVMQQPQIQMQQQPPPGYMITQQGVATPQWPQTTQFVVRKKHKS